MWPDVDLKKREISGFILNLRYINTAEWKKPDIVIKEIIMIFANYNNITFSHSDIVCALDYNTDFGWHTILFSKVPRSDFKFKGVNWLNIYSSNLSPKYGAKSPENDGPLENIDVQVLTDIYINTVKGFNEDDLVEEEKIPEDFQKKFLESMN